MDKDAKTRKVKNLSVFSEVIKLKSFALENDLELNVQKAERLLGNDTKLPSDIQAALKAGSAVVFLPESYYK